MVLKPVESWVSNSIAKASAGQGWGLSHLTPIVRGSALGRGATFHCPALAELCWGWLLAFKVSHQTQ